MRVARLYVQEAGPLGTQVIDLVDGWRGEAAALVLVSGPNGSGKSHMLRSMAMLWAAWGYWLHHRAPLKQRSAERQWLQRWGGVGLRLSGLAQAETDVIVAFGDVAFHDMLKGEGVPVIGELVRREGRVGNPRRELVGLEEDGWQVYWGQQYKKMMASFGDVEISNMIYLDAEERRWVSPRGDGLGEIKVEDSGQRWLSSYRVTERWEGQLEASLLALKASAPERFVQTLKSMNQFLSGKEILQEVKLGENRLRVKVGQRGLVHFLDDLSAGEHQVLIHIYSTLRWLEPGGVVMIDEPDLHLHPSLILGLMGELRRIVESLGGQLIVTSHSEELWRYCEHVGMRIELGRTQ